MLHEFLVQYQKEILELCKKKVAADSASKPTSELLDKGLPIFYSELIGVLERRTKLPVAQSSNAIRQGDAAAHGKESLRLGYSISQVVHSYGAVCQSITEFVQTKSFTITTAEFQELNFSLDCAIAEAVTEFEKGQAENSGDNESERIGYLMHEMKNSLMAVSAAHQMIQRGSVGGAGITSQVLSKSIKRIARLIEIAEAEIRFRGKSTVVQDHMYLLDIISEVRAAAIVAHRPQEIRLNIEVDRTIRFTADHHLIFSALSNLVSNAIKFTKEGGNIWVRGKESGERLLIEVEDECGGILSGNIEELFKPFVQQDLSKSGLGLGLALSRRAIELNHGTLTAKNFPGKGCIFTIDLPKT